MVPEMGTQLLLQSKKGVFIIIEGGDLHIKGCLFASL